MHLIWLLTGGFPMRRLLDCEPIDLPGLSLYQDRLGRFWWAFSSFDRSRISAEEV